MTDEIVALVIAVAQAHREVSPELLQAQVLVESGGDPYALRYERNYFVRYILNNPKAKAAQYGAFAACSIGLLQIMVETAYELGYAGRPERLFDPQIGLDWGVRQLVKLLVRSPDYRTALAAYNAGLGNELAGYGYADKVIATARRLKA